MLTKPTKCICCGRDSSWSQDGNVIFDSKGGNDGSKYYDNIMGDEPTFIRLVICDQCFLKGLKNGRLQAYVVEHVPRPDPKPVKWDPVENIIEEDIPMHETKVKLKNGEELYGSIWLWRPAEGFFTLVGSSPERQIYFKDVLSAVTSGQRNSIDDEPQDRDELQRAIENGWDGN